MPRMEAPKKEDIALGIKTRGKSFGKLRPRTTWDK